MAHNFPAYRCGFGKWHNQHDECQCAATCPDTPGACECSPGTGCRGPQKGERRADLLASSKALIELDRANALVPHGLGGHGRTCLTWCTDEIERLRAESKRLRETLSSVRITLSMLGYARDVDEIDAALTATKAADEAGEADAGASDPH